MIGGKMIGHRPISTSQHHPGAQRRQLRTGAIEAEQGQRGHGGRKPGKGMNLATSPQNECENRRRRPSRGLAHTPGTPIFALFRWTSERAASIRCPDGGSGQGSFASFLKGPLPPSGHRIERRTIDLQSDINCLPERSLLGAFGKQHDDYDHDVFNSAGSTLATPHFGPENGVHLRFMLEAACDFCNATREIARELSGFVWRLPAPLCIAERCAPMFQTMLRWTRRRVRFMKSTESEIVPSSFD